MLEITDYVEKIYKDFILYANGENCLCELKELNFQAGAIPDYEAKEIQQLYLLRYAFAYAFEYSNMYDDILSKINNTNQIAVTSIGCGAMIDYWSLIKSIQEKNQMIFKLYILEQMKLVGTINLKREKRIMAVLRKKILWII